MAGAQGSTPPESPIASSANIQISTPLRFSDKAAKEFASRVVEYRDLLELTSRAIARQGSADDVSQFHVQKAEDSLRGSGANSSKFFLDIGLLLLGAGIGYGGNVVVGAAYTFANAVIALAPISIGIGMYMYARGQQK